MSEFDQDKSMDDAWLEDLYRSSSDGSSGDEQTPAGLDRKILELAAKKSHNARTWIRWSTPLATAAVVLVSVSVYLNQPDSVIPFEEESSVYGTTSGIPEAEPRSVQTQDSMLMANPEPVSETYLQPAIPPEHIPEPIDPQEAAVEETVVQFQAPAPPMRAKRVLAEAEQMQAQQIEEVMVTAERSLVSAGRRGQLAAGKEDAALARESVANCEGEFELPEGAEILLSTEKAEVRFQFREQTFTARCEQGEWHVTPKTDL